METKVCTKCKSEKPLDEFRFRKDRGKRISHCHQCERGYGSAWYRDTKPARQEYRRKYEKTEGGKAARQRVVTQLRDSGWRYEHDRKKHVLRNYGLTEFEYKKLVQQQDGKCAICDIEPSAFNNHKRGLHVDHDHETNVVRGLLCGNCNAALGHFHDSVDNLAAAIQYLVRTKAQQEARKAGAG